MDGGIEVILGELIEMVQATAPMLWAIAQRQVLANTISNAVWAGLCILSTIALGWAVRYCIQQYRRAGPLSSWDMGAMLAGCVACVMLLATIACANDVIMYAVSPDYYAIKVLFQLVR